MNFIISLFIILSITFAIQLRFKRTFAEAISVSIFTIIMTLYLVTLFLPLTYSAYFTLGIAAIAFLYCIFYIIINWSTINFKIFFPYSFLYFLVCCVFINFSFNNRLATGWDEFSHWMLVIKNMYFFKNFGVGEYTTTMFTGYPPATGLFECFFTIFSPYFVEGNTYKGLNILLLSLLISPLKDNKLNFKTGLLSLFVFLSIPMLFYTPYTSLYVDCILGIMFARLVYISISEEKYDLFFVYNFTVSSSTLILTKASGAGLYAFGIIILFFDIVFFNRQKFILGLTMRNKPVKICVWSSIFIIPLLTKQSWKLYLKYNNLNEAWNTTNITLSGIFELFTENAPQYRIVTIQTFIDAFFNINEFGDIGFKCSYFLFPIIFTVIMIVIGSMGQNKKRIICLNLNLCISYFIYTLSLLILYLFTYTEYEAQNIASFARYMNTITVGYMIIVIICLMNPHIIHRDTMNSKFLVNTTYQRWTYITILIVTLFLTGIEIKEHLFYSAANAKQTQQTRSYYNHISELSGIFDYKTDRIYYIEQESHGGGYWNARYTLTPVSINPNFSWALANEPAEEDLWTKKSTAEEWSDNLKSNNYTYVYLDVINDQFRNEFGTLFSDPLNISDKTVYKVESNDKNNLVTLVPIY